MTKAVQTGSVTIPLTSALEIDGAKVKTLTMREPTLDDQMTAQEAGGSDAAQEVALIANLCMIAPADLRKLTLRDYMKVKAAFLGFID